MSTLKKFAKTIIPAAIRSYFRNFLAMRNYRRAGRESWLHRPNAAEDNHIDVYWKTADHANLEILVWLLMKVFGEMLAKAFSVLEYGSHVGVNFKNLKSRFNGSLSLYAVEPNRAAAESLRSVLPEINEGEDEMFVSSEAFPDSAIDVSFVNAVFYCMDAKRTKSVLRKLASISEYLVIGDEIENLDGHRTLRDKKSELSASVCNLASRVQLCHYRSRTGSRTKTRA